MGLFPQDALQRREAAQKETAERPYDPAAWIALSQACQTLVDEEGTIAAARRAVELAQSSIYSVCAGCARNRFLRITFERFREILSGPPETAQ